jgi:hypothetical protein
MKTIILPATPQSDLQWKQERYDTEEPILWEFDFGLSSTAFLLRDQVSFQSYIVALEQFARWKPQGIGVVLYRGSLDIVQKIAAAENISGVEAATLFGDYLHRLASFLSDDDRPCCFFEGPTVFTPAEVLQLTSKARFWHLHLSLEENKNPLGLLLPPDELCSSEVLQIIDELLVQMKIERVIPEQRLNELWDGLDELIVIEGAVSGLGQRHLRGFEAAGGKWKVRSRGIRTPDPLLPKQLR